MGDDIVDRLRKFVKVLPGSVFDEAADTIESLRAQVVQLQRQRQAVVDYVAAERARCTGPSGNQHLEVLTVLGNIERALDELGEQTPTQS